MLDAIAKEPRVLMSLKRRRVGESERFEYVALKPKHYRFATQLARACGFSFSEFFDRLLAVGVGYYPKAGTAKKEEIVSAIRTDCIIQFSRLA